MIINGVETFFPKAEARFLKEQNKIVIYFSEISSEIIKKTEDKINKKKAQLIMEEDYLILLLEDFQYAYDLNQSPRLIELYTQGSRIGFAFIGEDGNILSIPTPVFLNESV